MKTFFYPILKLIPIQTAITGNYNSLRKLPLEDLSNIPVIEHSDGFLIADKHTTAFILNQRRIIEWKVNVLENDLEFGIHGRGSYLNIMSIKSFIANYEEIWKVRLEKNNIKNISDLKIKNKKSHFF